jgi:hypothetical protein
VQDNEPDGASVRPQIKVIVPKTGELGLRSSEVGEVTVDVGPYAYLFGEGFWRSVRDAVGFRVTSHEAYELGGDTLQALLMCAREFRSRELPVREYDLVVNSGLERVRVEPFQVQHTLSEIVALCDRAVSQSESIWLDL